MQAYKGLYEDQLQTQHASAESYRSLTRGYSRLSADNKALRLETAAVAAAAGDAAGNAAALIASSAELQRSTIGARSGKEKGRRDQARESNLSGSGSGAGVEDGAAASRSAGNVDAPSVGGDNEGHVTTRVYAATAAESAAAVATAASAVAAAAGALAEATTSALPTEAQGSAAPIPPSIEKEEGESVGVGAGAAAAAAAAATATGGDGSTRSFERTGIAPGKKSGIRDRTAAAGSYGWTGTERPSTAETLACSPYSEKADTPPSTATGGPVAATAGKNGSAAGTEAGRAAVVDGQAPPADCLLARQSVTSRAAARADGDGGGDGGRTAKSYAFPQTAGEEDECFSCSTGIRASSSASAAAAAAATASSKPQHSSPQTRGGGTSKPDEPSGTVRSEQGAPRLTKAVPPVEPAPRWRGRSAGPGRLLATSASWAENVHVEAPKRSSSPVPARRGGRWGECVTDGAWGGGEGGARRDGCSRIEPSSRVRPHSI